MAHASWCRREHSVVSPCVDPHANNPAKQDHPVIPKGTPRAYAIEALLHDPDPTHWPLYDIGDMQRFARQTEERVRASVVQEMVAAATGSDYAGITNYPTPTQSDDESPEINLYIARNLILRAIERAMGAPDPDTHGLENNDWWVVEDNGKTRYDTIEPIAWEYAQKILRR